MLHDSLNRFERREIKPSRTDWMQLQNALNQFLGWYAIQFNAGDTDAGKVRKIIHLLEELANHAGMTAGGDDVVRESVRGKVSGLGLDTGGQDSSAGKQLKYDSVDHGMY